MSPSEWARVGFALVVVLLVALVIALRIIRGDPLLRSVRLGVFLERERFDEDDLDRGFDDDDDVRPHRQTYPPE